ncbi:M14 family metallopeptidase [Lacinutrix algicola]|uniref:M14 family metallopeptidase n=1 Tax=Lacinutrix algicola TaxID=342954 RepID=UPI0006E43003|nr:M14 family metallopeptidase [Lacinutrix algicola]
MKKILILILVIISFSCETKTNFDFTTVFEKSNGLETATYAETIAYYRALSKEYTSIAIDSIGETDSGKPLHIITLNKDKNFDFSEIRKNKRILLINNGIHPGESDGIDATMMLYRDLAKGKITIPDSTVIVTIPIYNIGGSLNRNSTSRTNQNGPKEYGFRGNARNYDLNRDFIKCDTKNAKSFAEIFHLVQPDVFIDNHVSNGADYQYTLTHLFTQHNKLGGKLGNYIHTEMMPNLEQKLTDKEWDITPYVNVYNRTPDNGFSQFKDSPRYSTGYTTLFNTLGMMVETHMLKPYKQRVEGTYELMKSMIEITENDGKKIKQLRKEANTNFITQKNYTLSWKIDTLKQSILNFKGFEGEVITSEVTGKNRLKYNRQMPFEKEVNYLNYFKPNIEVTIPKAYIIPKGWYTVIDLLKLNNTDMFQLKKDSTLTVESYRIEDYKSKKTPYEGHYLHFDTSISSSPKTTTFKEGDYIIKTNQPSFRYIVETLEPQAPDSFFNWNFFDTILQQKEGFSAYVWEDKALEILNKDYILKAKFEAKKNAELDFAKSWYAQLDWLHKHSENYEKAHLQYPVYRVLY